MITYNAIDIANRFVHIAKEESKTLTVMQLLKLVYLAHGWHLGVFGEPLIKEQVQAWKYGPVIHELYLDIKDFRSSPVVMEPARDVLDKDAEKTINWVYQHYGHLTGIQLSAITHWEGSPWSLTYEPGSYGTTISNDLIEDYYRKQIEE